MDYKPFEVDGKLSWEEKKQKYKASANKFKIANPNKDLKAFYTEYGQLIQPDGTGLQLKNKVNTGEPPDFQPKPRKTHQASSNKRNYYLKISNEHLSKEEKDAWEENRKKLNKQKLQADHVREVQETGAQIDTLRKQLKKGLITEAEYQRDLKRIRDHGSGHDLKRNGQGLTGKENSQKQKEVDKKDKSLAKLEKKKLSNRYKIGRFKGKTFQEIFAFLSNGEEENGDHKKHKNGTDKKHTNGKVLKLNGGGAAVISIKPEMKPLINVKSLTTAAMRGVMNLNAPIRAVDTLNTLTEMATGVNAVERTVHRAKNWDETMKQEQIDMQKRKEEQIQRNEQLKEFATKTFANVKSNVRSFRDGPLISTM